MNLYEKLKAGLFLMSGPCVIEEMSILEETVQALKEITDELGIAFIFKASFDKANRTSIKSFRGPGMAKGLALLAEIKKKYNVEIVTDVHSPDQVEKAAEVVDIIQIPAFLCRQTDLIVAAGKSGRIVNVKKAQFLAPESVEFIIEKLNSVKCREILITERGTSFGYGSLVVDFTGIPVMKKFGYPVVFDASHSVQKPSTGDFKTGGNAEAIPGLIYAAISSGVDGLFLETHPHPEKALSDKDSQFPLDKVPEVLKKAKRIYQLIEE